MDMTNTATAKSIHLSNKGGNWIAGTVGRFTVCAKVFEEGSHYGMPENDRISKLQIKDAGVIVFEYDRNDRWSETISTDDLATVVAAVTK